MTTTDTMDTIKTVEQSIRMIDAGCELVRITAPSMNEAKNLPSALVHPVFGILDAIFPLRFHILPVGLCDIFSGHSLGKIMNVHV